MFQEVQNPIQFKQKEPVTQALQTTLYSENSDSQITKKIRETFPEDPDTAVRVMQCESQASTTVISKTNDYGLFQINKAAHGIGDEMLDADTNIAYARKLYDERRGTWGAWYMSEKCWSV